MMEKLLFLVLCIVSVTSPGATARNTFNVSDVQHMRGHFQGSFDVDGMSLNDLLFHYFRIHDADGDNNLDGCELLQTLLHYHVELSVNTGERVKIFTDAELSSMVDAVLDKDDKNMDGFIDYLEFLSGDISKDF